MNLYTLRYRISKLIFPEVHDELAAEYQAHSRLGGEFGDSQRRLGALESQSRIMTDLLYRVRAVVPDECEGTGILREINRATNAQRVINHLEYPCGCHAGPAESVPTYCPDHGTPAK